MLCRKKQEKVGRLRQAFINLGLLKLGHWLRWTDGHFAQ